MLTDTSDLMSRNSCHFVSKFLHLRTLYLLLTRYLQGINSMFADNGLLDVQSWLYFPADPLQMVAIIERVFFERGLRFVFSTRAKVPYILKEDRKTKFFGDGYTFVPGKDDTIVDGKAGYVVSFGEMLYRSWDAVLRCREQGLDVGLINKATLNLVDEQVGSTSYILVTHPDHWNHRPSRRSGRVRLCLLLSPSVKRLG